MALSSDLEQQTRRTACDYVNSAERFGGKEVPLQFQSCIRSLNFKRIPALSVRSSSARSRRRSWCALQTASYSVSSADLAHSKLPRIILRSFLRSCSDRAFGCLDWRSRMRLSHSCRVFKKIVTRERFSSRNSDSQNFAALNSHTIARPLQCVTVLIMVRSYEFRL